MNTNELRKLYAQLPQSGALISHLSDETIHRVALRGLMASSAPVFFASLARKMQRPAVFILQDADTAGYFYNDLQTTVGDDGQAEVLFFPSSYRRAVKYGQRDAANEILRTEVLARVSASEARDAQTLYIVTHPEALAELVVAQQALDERHIRLRSGQTIDITNLMRQLRQLGFEERDYVYEPGQFAVRGSIVDVYSFSSELPFRIDFFGDEVDTLRTFTVEDQLSKDKKTEIDIVPQLAAVESQKIPFLQFLPEHTLLVSPDFDFCEGVVERIWNEGFSSQALTERMEGATETEQAKIRREMAKECVLCPPTQYRADAERFRHILLGKSAGEKAQMELQFHIHPQPLFHKNFDLLCKALEDYLLKGYSLYILADSAKQHQRLKDIFAERGQKGERLVGHDDEGTIVFTPIDHTLHEGYADEDLKACFFTDHQIFDRFHKYSLKSDKARAGKMALTMKELQEMEIGDYIVHVDFGIAKFGGLVRVPIAPKPGEPAQGGEGHYQEVIRLIYQNNDKVDVSIHSLYKISKYRAADAGEPPRLSTLGTGAWERLKEKAKTRMKEMARDLIRLYAKRRHVKGYSFSADTFMQHELEASFLYEDTPDQLKTTQEVKADMERARPMDRLICGDVGFGKTEVAIRAAFKAACDSKQVAVLVPTTVLAFQHYQTFRDRLRDFPVCVDYLSRARTTKQTKEVIERLKSGRIDIIVGTHKLLGKNVEWHDLGLLIIDEEHKFGVATKEKLRQLKTNVDTLTMSATPIPRTLQFSLIGARDMSVMRTPPPNRYPIHTELCTYDSDVITEAIEFEMSRNGQVFFVSNRISSLPEIADNIKKRVPDCRIAVGHGQMPPDELEKIIMGFINYDYDVLLSTTIIENGIDIPNANTIIISGANHFGLSDLHQMRGRVGRSNRKAFCYLLAPPKNALPSDVRRRLEALETFSELGSGFNLAMQDLDIRGAGNLLGTEQSGFMEDLGYETYQKILNQAVTELRNDEFQDLYENAIKEGKEIDAGEFVEDCSVESDLEMYFPDTYVPGASERMLLYRELDQIVDEATLQQYRQRLVDRFGPVPAPGEELMHVVTLRRVGKRLGCEKIVMKQGNMTMQFVSNPQSPFYQSKAFGRIIQWVMANARRSTFKDVRGHRMIQIKSVPSVTEALGILRNMESMA